MGTLYEFFAAEDDAAAVRVLTVESPPPVFRDEAPGPETLAMIEARLSGRSEQEIAADPRHHAVLAEQVDEDAGVIECGVATVTDTLTQALAGADTAELASAARAWEGAEVTVRGLAAVARHAAARGQRVYCLWIV